MIDVADVDAVVVLGGRLAWTPIKGARKQPAICPGAAQRDENQGCSGIREL